MPDPPDLPTSDQLRAAGVQQITLPTGDHNVWAQAITDVYSIAQLLLQEHARREEQENDSRHFFAARVIKHMDVAIEVWDATRSQVKVWEAWFKAVGPEVEQHSEQVWDYVGWMIGRLCHEFFIPNVWDHVRNPSI